MWVDFVVCGAHFFLILHVYSSINIIIKNLPALVLKSTTTKSTVQKSFKISLYLWTQILNLYKCFEM